MKYAFDDKGGIILVKLQEDGEDIVLSVIDDGKGAVEQEDAPKSTGLGSRLMTAFAKQLRAEMTSHSEPGKGYTVELRMPATERVMKTTEF